MTLTYHEALRAYARQFLTGSLLLMIIGGLVVGVLAMTVWALVVVLQGILP